MANENKSIVFFHRILSKYFLVQYIILVISFQYGVNLEILNIIFFTIAFFYVMNKMRRVQEEGFQGQSFLVIFLVYCCFFISVLSFTTLFASNPSYSFIRILITAWLLFTMMVVFYYIFIQIQGKEDLNKAVSKSLFLILLVATLGQLLIPEWAYGLRLSGGVNPNGMGYIALFCNFWFAYQKIDKSTNSIIAYSGWLLSFIVVLWAMSRTVFLSLGVLYAVYFFFLILFNMYKLTLKRILLFPVFCALLFTIYNYVRNSFWYQQNIARLLDSTNLVSRESAWALALEKFKENIWVGSAGWWNMSKILDSSYATTDSPHSLYLRLLSETGIIGLITVLVLPLFLLLALIFKASLKEVINKKQVFLITGMLLGLFAGLAFEDRYLTGFGGFNTGAIVWVMAMGVVNLSKQSPKGD
ncbi:O-antigen ligase family protein [Alteribacillus iranensis]|uniref:O-antigen ligase n=1 Tax=Alteribacillus iranensis TaxID=930128 RepID=A0A1I2BGJ8_9BACI|nr:O-antigen ligase family protein [Alteribacillus iranensis]SFE55291.1 O-antigen ligase [Alteribacillus iranensis]